MGKPCVSGAAALEIDLDAKTLRVNGAQLAEGDTLVIDGSAGVVTTDDVPLEEPKVSDAFETVLSWADELRQLGVRTNADTPEDAARAREFGAEGVGLCRTEHMFMAADRQPKMRRMIMAETEEERRSALDKLLPLQQEDFEGLFHEMRGLPVTIRLLDPPLHEFLPHVDDVERETERARIEQSDELEQLERTLRRVHDLEETNPMLGTRGVRLGVLHPEIYEMQARAIVRAAQAVAERSGEAPQLEIMIPLVAYEKELELMRELVLRVVGEEGGEDLDVLIGTMIELPRACFVADRIARAADFFSFGTNDLTQTALGFSRDDVESSFLPHYMKKKIVDRSPFETIDRPGVGWLIRLAAWTGREAKPELKLGICGEHGGDPDSIRFFQLAGLDYVSCSPYRVPIARVAAAQAALED
jgi:pyruvate,orthophosphate dikinase